jgi:hypothetical protein
MNPTTRTKIINIKKGPKNNRIQPDLIFKTRDTNYEAELQHKRQA